MFITLSSFGFGLSFITAAQGQTPTAPPGEASTQGDTETQSAAVPSPAAAAASQTATAGPQLSLTEAIQTTLEKHPSIADARALADTASAGLGISEGRFDPVVNVGVGHRHERLPLLPGHLKSDTTSAGVGASAAFKWGTIVTPSMTLERIHERTDPMMAGFRSEPIQRARADLTITQPLLRGFGTDGSASDVYAAEHNIRSAGYVISYTAQSQVFVTVASYWELVAIERNVALFQLTRDRAERLVRETQELVNAEQRPRADLRYFEGNLANQKRAALEAETARLIAIQNLGLAMGLDPRTTAPWHSAGSFPQAAEPPADYEALVQQALNNRQDVQAAEADVKAAQALFDGADHNSLPALDLSMSVGYSGAVDDDGVGPFFEAAGRNVSGANGAVLLSLELPVTNRAQNADLALRLAQLQRAQIARRDLERQVRAEVRIAMDEQRVTAQTVAAAEEAAQHFRQAIQDERDKLKEGLSTVIDVVLTETRLTDAELSLTNNQFRHAVAQARLSFALGSLPSQPSEAADAAKAIANAEAVNGRN